MTPTPAPRYDPLDLLTIDEVATLTKRHRRTIEREVATGVLQSVLLGRRRLVPRAELERYIAAGTGYNVDDPIPIEEARRDH
jgi:excisionase family DNA binding protein